MLRYAHALAGTCQKGSKLFQQNLVSDIVTSDGKIDVKIGRNGLISVYWTLLNLHNNPLQVVFEC